MAMCRQSSSFISLALHQFHRFQNLRAALTASAWGRNNDIPPSVLFRISARIPASFSSLNFCVRLKSLIVFGMFDLVVEKKLTRNSSVQLAFRSIRNCGSCANPSGFSLSNSLTAPMTSDKSCAYCNWSNNNPIRLKLFRAFFRFRKVADQTAADASGIHFLDFTPASFSTNFPSIPLFCQIHSQSAPFSLENLPQQFFDQRCFSCAEKSAKSIRVMDRHLFSLFLPHIS